MVIIDWSEENIVFETIKYKLVSLGATSKKEVVLDGAHQKVEDNPPPPFVACTDQN